MKKVALVGNGINDAQKITWNGLLNYVQDKLDIEDDKKLKFNQNISPIIAFDSLCKQNKEPRVRELVKKYIEDKSNFVDKIWTLFDVVITTNFDNNLLVSSKKDSPEIKLPNKESVTKIRIDFQYKKIDKMMFPIHGYYKSPDTICLGLDQYTDNLKRIQSYVENKKKNKLKKEKSPSWINYFFEPDTEINIIGLNLCPSEIDLWWLLNYRAKVFNELKNNVIKYFDLKANKENENYTELENKFNILKSMKVEVEQIEEAIDYNSDFYSYCINHIKNRVSSDVC